LIPVDAGQGVRRHGGPESGRLPDGLPAPRRGRRRKLFLWAFLHALRDGDTFDVRANPGLWLGFVLALPIPILSFASSNPPWVDAISLTAPVVWAALLGAAARVARLGEDEIERAASAASASDRAHSSEHARLRASVVVEQDERERLEAMQDRADAELVLAQSVHRSLLPEDVRRADVEIAVRQVPCALIGGDYLQAVFPRPDLLYLCVGDVSGHGIAAALVVSRIHALVLKLIFEQRPPDQFLEEINRASLRVFERMESGLFLTFGVFRVDLSARRIDYATAGHPAQLLLRSDGACESLATENGLLGVSLELLGPVRPGSAPYRPGDSLVLFTDGLFEVPSRRGEGMLEEAGLRAMLCKVAAGPSGVVASEVLRAVADFARAGPFDDDVSLMVARFAPER
jgi:serine phosphatase RsbU (regulator of sigma subunit)